MNLPHHQMPSRTMECTWKPEITGDPMEFLSRSWSSSAVQVSKALLASTPADGGPEAIPEETREEEPSGARNPFSFASSATSQLVLERIMSQSQEVSPLTSGRLSHSSGPLNGGGSLSDSPPVSPSEFDEIKLCRTVNTPRPQYNGGSRTVGRWLKDRRERKKEESRAHNAQLHAAVSVAGVAAAVAAVASASAGKGCAAASRADLAVASAATLVAAQCVEAAEAMGADRDHLAAVVGSAVSVRNSGDIATLTAAAATALRGAATLKARVLKEAWNLAAVIPVEKGSTMTQNRPILKNHKNADPDDLSGELVNKNNLVSINTLEFLARGTELLKRTRKGALHWKMVSVYIHRSGVVMLKMKSRHVAGTFTKKKKSVVTAVCEDIAAWPGRHLSEGEELRRYFGLRTANRRVTEFECRGRSEYEMFTNGVVRLLEIVANGKQFVR